MEKGSRSRLVGLLKRLPFLLVLAVGLAIWKTGYLPQDRTLVWTVPDDPTIGQVEIQIWDGDVLLTRDELTYPDGPPSQISQKARLGRGDYRVQVWVERRGLPPISGRTTLEVRGKSLIEQPLPLGGASGGTGAR